MRHNSPETRFKNAHYYEVRSRTGVSNSGWTWGSVERIAADLSTIYKEPNLRRIIGFGGDITVKIHSQNPEQFRLNPDGSATRIADVNKRLNG